MLRDAGAGRPHPGGDRARGLGGGSAGIFRAWARIAVLGLPMVVVQEGGYAVAEIGDNVIGVLAAFATP